MGKTQTNRGLDMAAYRRMKRVSQNDLARSLGVMRATVIDVERGAWPAIDEASVTRAKQAIDELAAVSLAA